MGDKRDIKVFIFPVLVILAFLFSIIGYKQVMGDDFSLIRTIYSTITIFVLENITPDEIRDNPYVIISKFLAAILLGFGIYTLLYNVSCLRSASHIPLKKHF